VRPWVQSLTLPQKEELLAPYTKGKSLQFNEFDPAKTGEARKERGHFILTHQNGPASTSLLDQERPTAFIHAHFLLPPDFLQLVNYSLK
jgi:hypothetical protein